MLLSRDKLPANMKSVGKQLIALVNSKYACCSASMMLVAICSLYWTPIRAQDLLRNVPTHQNGNHHNQNIQNQQQIRSNANNVNNLNTNLLANIQLPPQLASLTPQQLHQLAQIREFQLQQEAAAKQRQQDQERAIGAVSSVARGSHDDQTMNQGDHLALANNFEAPAPLGLENAASIRPTVQPSGSSVSDQIPQPNLATTSTSKSERNDRHDDGSYNESGSEMEGVAASDRESPTTTDGSASSSSQSSGSPVETGATNSAQATPTFEVNWNKCPQLEPSESEKNKKTLVITKCLQMAPIPTNLTHENVEAHRENIATCALKVEGWFDNEGAYKYDKAETEIRAKKLEPAIEIQVLKFHVACKDEANRKFPREQNKSLIDQVQFYQACMDYYISIVCEIEVSVDQ